MERTGMLNNLISMPMCFLIAGILIGYLIPHYKIYESLCDHFIAIMRKRNQKIHELMLENNRLRKTQK